LIEERRINVDCKEDGTPAICGAAREGHNNMIEYLLSVGANINAKNMHDRNSLHFAAFEGKFETVKLLVSLGCDFNAKDENGDTPLQHALEMNETSSAEFLKQVAQKYVCDILVVAEFYFSSYRFPKMKKSLRLCRIVGSSLSNSHRKQIIFKLIMRVRF
jgi:ankyrin repeat protein